MSLLFFASMAPLLAKSASVQLEAATIEPPNATSHNTLEQRREGDRQPRHTPSANMASPEFLHEAHGFSAQASATGLTPTRQSPLDTDESTVASERRSEVATPVSQRYQVQPGDTLWDLAQRLQVPLSQILAANPNIVPEQLPVGYALIVPHSSLNPGDASSSPSSPSISSPSRSSPSPALSSPALPSLSSSSTAPVPKTSDRESWVDYRVQPGDTVWAIAQRFNTTPDDILAANPGVIPIRLQPQQSLQIPTGLAALSQSPSTSAQADVQADSPVAEPPPLASPADSPTATTPPSRTAPDASHEAPNILGAPWFSPETEDITWKLGAIALIGLGLTLMAWYGWKKHTEGSLAQRDSGQTHGWPHPEGSGLSDEAALRLSSASLLTQGAIADAEPPATRPHPSGSSQVMAQPGSSTLLPQLSLKLALFFGSAIAALPLQAVGLTATPKPHAQSDPAKTRSVHTPAQPPAPTAPESDDSLSSSVQDVSNFREGDETSWSTSLEHVLNQPPSHLPYKLILGGILFFLVFGTWAWLGTIEEVGQATGQLIPQGEVYEVEFPTGGRIAKVAVTEGENVKAGQILFELDTQIAEAEVQRLQDLLATYDLELQEKQRLIPQLQREAEATALLSQNNVEAQSAAIQRIQANAATTEAVNRQLQADIAAQQERLNRINSLVNEGAVSQEYLFQVQQALREQQRSITENQGNLAESRSQISQFSAELNKKQAEGQQQQIAIQQKIQQIRADIANLQARILDTHNQLNQAKAELNQRYMYAPVGGTVSSIAVANTGAVVQSGETIAEIIPEGVPLILSAILPDEEAGLIAPGLPVQIKLNAYPFQDFGIVPGTVKSIAPDAENHEELGAVYRVEISLNQNYLKTSDQAIEFKPGATAIAEIVIRKRRIADVLLDPIKQLQQDGLSL